MSRHRSLRSLREKLRERDGNNCFVCGLPMRFDYKFDPGDDGATIEHIKERVNGGTWKIKNLALSHRRCNMARSRLRLFELRWSEMITSKAHRWRLPAWPALDQEGEQHE